MNNFLVSTSKKSAYITTTRLPEYIPSWVDLQRSGEKSSTRNEKRRAHTILMLVLSQLDIVSDCENFALVDRTVVLGIAVLQEALFSAWGQAFGLDGAFLMCTFNSPQDGREVLVLMMLREGWYFHEIQSLSDLPPSLRCVAALMKRPVAGKEHLRCFKQSRSIAYDETAYETKHSRMDCSCHHIRTDEEQM